MLQKVKPAVQLKDMNLFRQQCYINGEWVDADNKSTFAVYNPADGQQIGTVPNMGAAETRRAIETAHAAWHGWRAKTAKERAAILRKWYDLMMANQEDLAVLMTVEQGKPLTESRGEIAYGASFIEWFAEEGKRVYGDTIPAQANDRRIVVLKQPVGVCAAVTPWNFPNAMITRKAGPALAAGCTMVIKPSEFTSASILELMDLIEEAGVPRGVVNVVTGFGPEVGEPLVTHPKVAKVAFTGGEAAGRRVYQAAAASFKRVTLELGGKSPNIVFDDADLDAAVNGAISGIFAATGQTCIAGSRLLLQESVHDAFMERLVETAAKARMGDPQDFETQVGPVTTPAQYQKVLDYIGVARAEGAVCVLGGGPAEADEGGGKWFVKPTIFTGVNNAMRIAQEEVFGPVLSVIPFRDEDEAVAIANDVLYGLAAGVWTQSLARATVMAKRLRAGTVWINTYRAVSMTSPFGGFKASGLGRENGLAGIEGYLETKSVWVNTAADAGNPFVMKLAGGG